MHIVVIGHGMVGHKFLETLAASGQANLRVTVLGEEPRPAYDRLVLATGSYPFVPPVPGADRQDCFVYRTIEDLEAMRACAARGARCRR